MSSRNRIPPHAHVLIAVLALTLGLPASGSDLHLADPPSDVAKETTVCTGKQIDELDLLATICTTTWRNSTPGLGEWRHAHVVGTLKNTSTQQKPRYIDRIEILSEANVVKFVCYYKAYLKPNQTAKCAEGMVITVGLPNMRIYTDWHMHEI